MDDTTEADKIRYHRREEARDLRTSIIPLSLIFLLTYLILVRKHPERRLLFAVFVFTFTPIALDVAYVFQKSHFGDFPSFFYGADYIYNQGLSPYGTILSEQVERHISPFFHPPPCVLIFKPWAHMTYNTALIVSNTGNQVALCVLLYFLIVRKRTDSQLISVCLLLYIMNFYPVRMTLDYGQINLWTTVFICVFIHATLARKSPALMGLSLACAVVLKIYPGCLLAYLIVKRQWKAIGWCMGGMAAVVGLALVMVPWHIWESWWGCVGSRGLYGGSGPIGIFSPGGPWNQGLNGLMMRIFTDSQFSVALIPFPEVGKVLTYTLALLVLGTGGGLLLWREYKGIRDEEELELGLVLVMMSLVVPLSWVHHGVMLLPALIPAARRLFNPGRRWVATVFVMSACALAWEWDCFPDEHFRLFQGGVPMLLGSMRAFGLIGLFVAIMAMLAEPWRQAKDKSALSPS